MRFSGTDLVQPLRPATCSRASAPTRLKGGSPGQSHCPSLSHAFVEHAHNDGNEELDGERKHQRPPMMTANKTLRPGVERPMDPARIARHRVFGHYGVSRRWDVSGVRSVPWERA